MIAGIVALLLLLQDAFVPGAVVGHLDTIDGVPAVATRVVAIAVPRGNGKAGESLNYFELAAPVDKTLTDNEGNFRMQELPPGRYFILAGALPLGTYYPEGADVKDAEIVTVEAGAE